jgi:hypothetical protein
MSYKKQELLIICVHLGSLHGLGGVRVAHDFSKDLLNNLTSL